MVGRGHRRHCWHSIPVDSAGDPFSWLRSQFVLGLQALKPLLGRGTGHETQKLHLKSLLLHLGGQDLQASFREMGKGLVSNKI